MSKLESIHTTAILEDGTKVSLAMVITSLMDRVDALETALDAAQRHRQSEDEWQDSEVIREIRSDLEEIREDQREHRRELDECVTDRDVADIVQEQVHHAGIVTEDDVDDHIATYVMDDAAGVLRRAVLSIVADKLLGR
jgi:predicted Holliday junction resolvase-like endonuclease